MKGAAGIVAVAVALGQTSLIQPAWASWPIGFAASNGEARSGPPPGAPTGVSSSCPPLLAGQVTVTWSAVSLATSYAISQSTTSATSGFNVVVGGIVGTSWTSNNLASGKYWFEVTAYIGSNWAGPPSAATGPHTVFLDLSCS